MTANEKYKGYIYAASNPVYDKALLKIGFTQKKPDDRILELFRGKTAVPQEFKLEYACSVNDCRAAESYLHDLLSGYRHKSNREFFYITADIAKKLILAACKRFSNTEDERCLEIIDNTANPDAVGNFEDEEIDNEVVYVSLSRVVLPNKKQSVLSTNQTQRVNVIMDVLTGAIKDTITELIDSFEMDFNPEIEISVYESICKEYLKVTCRSDFELKQLPEVVKLLECLTLFNKKHVKMIYKPKNLSVRQMDEIVRKSSLRIVPLGGTIK